MLKREIIVETDVRVNGKNKHNREVFYIFIQRAIRNTSQMIFFFVPDKKGSKNTTNMSLLQ
jgi:fructose-specific phosphotransferase system component IIB